MKNKRYFDSLKRRLERLFPIPDVENIIERQQTFVFLYVSFGFLSGITLYLISGIMPLRNVISYTHLIQAALIITLLILRCRSIIKIRTALCCLVFSIQFSISMDMYHIASTINSEMGIPEVLGCWALLCILIPLSITVYWRPLPYILTAISFVLYAVCAVIADDSHLKNMLPLLGLAIVVLMFMGDKLVQVVNALRLKERNISLKHKQVLEFLNMDEAELFHAIRLMRRNKLSLKQKNQLLDLLGEQAKTTALELAEDIIKKQKQNLSELDSSELGLSTYEKQICLLIIDGVSTGNITKKLARSYSAITSARSVIRTKLGLQPKDDLREVLLRMVEVSTEKTQL